MQSSAGKTNRAMVPAEADALPPSGRDGKWRAGAESGARERSLRVRGVGGVGGGGGEQEEETRGEKWSWASRVRQRSPVPGAQPGEEEEGVEAVRGPGERRRGPLTSRLRGGSDRGGLAGGGTGARGRRGRWQALRGPRRA